MSAAAARRARPAPSGPLEAYADDGPLALALGRALGPAARAPAALLVAVGALPLVVLLAARGDAAPRGAVGAVVAWLVVVAGTASGRPHRGRSAWLVPPLLRAVEYTSLLWLGTLAGAVPAAFALVATLTFRHYDVVYRLRHQGVAPPAWLAALAGGWDGRVLLGFVLLAAGALRVGFFVLAAVLGVVFVAEASAGWLRFARAQRPQLYADEEDEDE